MTPQSELLRLAWSHLWQVTAVICLIGLVVRVGCRSKPHLAYLLWMLAILKCVTPPVWSSSTGIFSWATVQVHHQHHEEPASRPSNDAFAEIVPSPISAAPLAASPEVAPRAIVSDNLPTKEVKRKSASSTSITIDIVLGFFWSVGALALGVIACLKSWRLHRLAHAGRLADDHPIVLSTARLAERLGLRRPVRVATTERGIGPAVWGVLRPCILVPEQLVLHRSVEQLQPILAHELTHVRRRDPLFGAVQTIAQILWWFHPLVWWANRQACHERERSCDQQVLARFEIRPGDYARSLLDVLKLNRNVEWLKLAPGMNSLQITSKRLEEIMNRNGHYQGRTALGAWSFALVSALILLPGGAMVVGGSPVNSAQVDQEPESADTPSTPSQELPTENVPTGEGDALKLRGSAQPGLDVTLPAQLSGVVASMNVSVGSHVEAGQLLARINAATMDATEAQLDLDIARFRAEQDIPVRYAQKAMELAKVSYDIALSANKRRPGTTPELEVLRRKLDWERATAQLDQERLNQEMALLTAKSKEAVLRAAKERSRISAPLAGEVLETHVQAGEWVNAGDPICRVVSMETMLIHAYAPAGKYDPGDILDKHVEIVVQRARGRVAKFVGKVIYVNLVIDSVNNQYKIHIAADNRKDEDGHWLLRSRARVQVVLSD